MKKDCRICDGTGWVREEGVESVKRCKCFHKKRIEQILKNSGIPERYRKCRLDNFNIYTVKDGKRSINRGVSVPHEVAREFILGYPNVNKGIMFTGQCGVGKTHIASAILMEIMLKKGASVRFCNWRELMKSIQACYAGNGNSERDVLEPVLNCDLLCLDELGAKKVSDFFLDTLTVVINTRYSHNKLTIITSNWLDKPRHPTEESITSRIGYSLRSRLYEMCQTLEVDGDDYRAKQKDGLI